MESQVEKSAVSKEVETGTPSVAPSVGDQEVSNTSREADPEYLPPAKRYSLIGALCLITLMIAIDTTIVATAVPKITDEFQTIADVGWYAAAYMIGNSALQPFAGKVFTYSPVLSTYLFFIALFEVGSIVCATAPSSNVLVVGRAIAGMGSAGTSVGAFIVLTIAAPKDKQPMLMGVIMAMLAGGQLIGPLIGGAFTQHVSWRWCFWINLPVGGAAALAILLTRVHNHHRRRDLTLRNFANRFDIVGFVVFAPACIMLLLALEWGGHKYAWNDSRTIGLFVGSGASFIVLVVWEYFKGDEAMFPRNILGQRVIWSGCVAGAAQFGALLLIGYFLPLWFQSIERVSPTLSAVRILPTFIAQIVASIVAGATVNYIGFFSPYALFAAMLTTIGAGLMTLFVPGTSAGLWIGSQILVGIGRGFGMQQPLSAAQASLSGPQMATGTAVVTWSTWMGGAIAVALAQTMFTNILKSEVRKQVPSIDPQDVIDAGATDYVKLASGSTLDALYMAYDKAIANTFYLAVGLSILSFFFAIGLGWTRVVKKRERKPKKQPPESKV